MYSFMIICYTCTEYDCYDLINKFHCIITYKTKKNVLFSMMRDTGFGVVGKAFIHMWKIGCSNPGCDKPKLYSTDGDSPITLRSATCANLGCPRRWLLIGMPLVTENGSC